MRSQLFGHFFVFCVIICTIFILNDPFVQFYEKYLWKNETSLSCQFNIFPIKMKKKFRNKTFCLCIEGTLFFIFIKINIIYSVSKWI